jgi:hypothetical protein
MTHVRTSPKKIAPYISRVSVQSRSPSTIATDCHIGDFCHKRSIRCKPSSKPESCENCVDFGLSCTYNRPIKRGRGHQKPPDEPAGTTNGVSITTEHNEVLLPPGERLQSKTTIESLLLVESALPDASWKAFASVSHSLIIYLIDIYFQVVYPMSVHRVLITSPYSKSQARIVSLSLIATLCWIESTVRFTSRTETSSPPLCQHAQ